MKKPRRNHVPAFKARMALEVLRGEKTVAQLSALYGVHPTQLTSWKNELLEGAVGIFGGGATESVADQERIRELHAKIGELTVERDFLGQALGKFPIYYNERVIEGTVDSDAGAMLRDGIKTLAKQGVCADKTWPYQREQFADKPPAPAYREGLQHQALSYLRLAQDAWQMKEIGRAHV